MSRVLITGASRGLGLSLTQVLLERGHRVFASCRDPKSAEPLKELSRKSGDSLEILPLDVTDDLSIQTLTDQLQKSTPALDVLINNAGIGSDTSQRLGRLDRQVMERVFRVNAISPVMVTQALLEFLQQGERPLVVNISSIVGSIAGRNGISSRFDYDYCASKAALNMITVMMGQDLRERHIGTLAIHPGWVRTDMGGPEAPLSPDESAGLIADRMEQFTFKQSGSYLTPEGNAIHW